MWIKNLAGEKAQIDDADRELWGMHGWTVTVAPADRDFVWMRHPDLGEPGNPIAWGAAREYWQKIGWEPGPPPAPVNPTRDPALTDAAAEAPPDGSVAEVAEWVGTDTARAEQALAAELTRPKPRKSLVDDLNKVGQPEDDAAPAAPNKEA
jgi:hypothetical protein